MLTGATGLLGAHILADLLDNENVHKVYCLVRPHRSESASARLFRALALRHVVLSDVQSAKISILLSDFSKENLDLDAQELADLRKSTTVIIHCAWVVNFNLTLQSFEKQHIQGVHNLINFSLSVQGSKPARFIFCSSVSVGTNVSAPSMIAEGLITDFTHAQPTGYARSKLVAEHIVQKAAIEAGALSNVFRIGQIAGDSRHGLWSDNDAIPLMIRTALTIGTLPSLDEVCQTISLRQIKKLADTLLDMLVAPCRHRCRGHPRIGWHLRWRTIIRSNGGLQYCQSEHLPLVQRSTGSTSCRWIYFQHHISTRMA